MESLSATAARNAAVALLAVACWPAVGYAQATAGRGKELFIKGATPPCSICHALADAGAVGAIGPSLDELKPDAERVAKAVKSGIGQMPAFSTLSEQDVQAISQYVAKASGGAK